MIAKLKKLKFRLYKLSNSNSNLWKEQIAKAILHNNFRANLPTIFANRAMVIVKEITNSNYANYSNGLASVLKDLFIKR